MPAIDTYTAGTVTLTNNSAVVTGAAVNWINGGKYNVMGGHWFRYGSFVALILNVDSATQITLATPFTGATVAGASYQIFRYTRLETPEAVGLLQSLLDRGSATSPFSRLDIDSGALRASFRDDGSGNLGWYIGGTGTADGSQIKLATLNKTDGTWTLGQRLRVTGTDVVFGSATGFSPITANLQQVGTTGGSSVFSQVRGSSDGFGPVLVQGKSRSGTSGQHGLVQSGDQLGRYWAFGSDGTNFIQAAGIEVYADGTPGTNDMPGRISFHTTPAGSAATSERMRIVNTGFVGIGGAAAPDSQLTVRGAGQSAAGFSTSATLGATLALRDTGSSSGNGGAVMFGASQGYFAAVKGRIGSGADNTVGSISLVTRTLGTDATLSEKLNIGPLHILFGFDNQQNLGGPSNRGAVAYFGTGAINTSDAREKTPVRALTDAELAAASDLAGEIGIFQWLDMVAEKGEDQARLHIGMTVQRAIEIMEGHDLEPWRYGFICRDEITRKVVVTRTVTVQATDEVEEVETAIEIRDGVPVQVTTTRPVSQPRFTMIPVIDEAGNPVMRVVLSDEEDGEPTLEALLHPVPVMVEIEREVEIEESAGDRLGFRYDQLALFILRGMLARIEAAGG